MRARRADVCRTASAFPQSGSGSGSCGATLTCAQLGLGQTDSSVPSTVLSAVGCACGGHAAAFRASDIASGACAKGCCARQAHAPRPRADASCDNGFYSNCARRCPVQKLWPRNGTESWSRNGTQNSPSSILSRRRRARTRARGNLCLRPKILAHANV